VPAEQRQVDEGEDIVDGVVVLGDAQRPAELGPVGAGVGVGEFGDLGGRYPSLRLGGVQGPLLDTSGELIEAGGGPLDEVAVVQPGVEDLAGDGVGQGDVGADVQGQPRVGEAGGRRAPRIDYEQLRAPALRLEDMVEEDRMGLSGVGAPQDDNVGVLDFPI